jgi:hypothetical protein
MAVNVIANPINLSWLNFRVVDSSPDLSGDEVAQIHPEMRLPPNIQVVNSNGVCRLSAFTIMVGLCRRIPSCCVRRRKRRVCCA